MSLIDKSKIKTDEQLLIWLASLSNPNIAQENMAKHHIDRASVKVVTHEPYVRTVDLTYEGTKYPITWTTVLPNELFSPEELIIVVPAKDWKPNILKGKVKPMWDARIAELKTIPPVMRDSVSPNLVNEANNVNPDITNLTTVRSHYYVDDTTYHIQGAFTVRFYKDSLPLSMIVKNTNLGGFTAQQLTQED